jgi:hypothetical protein
MVRIPGAIPAQFKRALQQKMFQKKFASITKNGCISILIFIRSIVVIPTNLSHAK